MEDGENNIIDAAKREVMEETDFGSATHQLIYSYHPQNGISNKVFHILKCKALNQVRSFAQDEVGETRWFSRTEIDHLVKDKYYHDSFTLTALLVWLHNIR